MFLYVAWFWNKGVSHDELNLCDSWNKFHGFFKLAPLSHVSTFNCPQHGAAVSDNLGCLWTLSHVSSDAVHGLASSTAAVVTTASIWKRCGASPWTAWNVHKSHMACSCASTFCLVNWAAGVQCRYSIKFFSGRSILFSPSIADRLSDLEDELFLDVFFLII